MENWNDEDWYDEENIYAEGAREHLIEDGELSAVEEGFMKGYEEAK